MSRATFAHVSREPYTLGTETCYVGTTVHSAELGVHFLEIFPKGAQLWESFKKIAKKKSGAAWGRERRDV
jgi:hypothetical protein